MIGTPLEQEPSPIVEGPEFPFPWGVYFAAWIVGPVLLGYAVIALAVKIALRKKSRK